MLLFLGQVSEVSKNFDINSEDVIQVTNIEANGTKEGEPCQFPGM